RTLGHRRLIALGRRPVVGAGVLRARPLGTGFVLVAVLAGAVLLRHGRVPARLALAVPLTTPLIELLRAVRLGGRGVLRLALPLTLAVAGRCVLVGRPLGLAAAGVGRLAIRLGPLGLAGALLPLFVSALGLGVALVLLRLPFGLVIALALA